MKKSKASEEVKAFLKEIASRGGHARAKKYTRKQISEWCSRGGRPRKNSK